MHFQCNPNKAPLPSLSTDGSHDRRRQESKSAWFCVTRHTAHAWGFLSKLMHQGAPLDGFGREVEEELSMK